MVLVDGLGGQRKAGWRCFLGVFDLCPLNWENMLMRNGNVQDHRNTNTPANQLDLFLTDCTTYSIPTITVHSHRTWISKGGVSSKEGIQGGT